MGDEKGFENRIKRWFHSIGIYPAGYGEEKMIVEQIGWYTKIWGGGFQKSGIPDIIACVKGQFVSIEIKATTGRPSPLQELNTNRIRDSGGHGCFLYPTGFEDFQTDLLYMIESLKCDLYAPKLKGEYK